MIGYKIDLDGTHKDFLYATTHRSLRNMERFITNRGEIYIELEHIEHNNGFYKLFGYISGSQPFNDYAFDKCNPKGDVLLLAYNTYGENRDVNWNHFDSIYNRTDILDNFLLTDELHLLDYQDEQYEANSFLASEDEEFEYMMYNPYGDWTFDINRGYN